MSSPCLNLPLQKKPIPTDLGTNPSGLRQLTASDWELEKKCAGVINSTTEMTFAQWKAVWNGDLPDGRYCTTLFNDIINTSPNNTYNFNKEMYTRINETMDYMMSKYFNQTSGNNLVLPGQSTWDEFQNTLVTSCRESPGSCTTSRASLCDGCDRAQIANNPDLLALCGCVAPLLDPTIYRETVSRECDPLCSQQISSKIVDNNTGIVAKCNDTICVMDNISITATKSSVSGVQISQVCPGCTAETGCKCIVDVSVANMSQSLGLDTPTTFQQYCPPEFSTCIVINSVEQTSTVVPCDNYFKGATPQVKDSSIPFTIYAVAIFIAALVILALFVYIFSAWSRAPSKYKPPPPVPPRPIPKSSREF
jgi:hypothetical protein